MNLNYVWDQLCSISSGELKMKKYPTITLIAIALLSFSIFIQPSSNWLSNESISGNQQLLEPVILSGYTVYDPIIISNDGNFSDYGFPGDGTEGNPYRIENISITHDGTAIDIDDVSVHFEINSCWIESNSSGAGFGITINNALHGAIFNTTLLNFNRGIMINTATVDLIGNTVTQCNAGIYFYRGVGLIENNTISDITSQYGLRCWQSSSNTINNNSFSNVKTNDGGLSLYYSRYNTVSNNTFTEAGVVLQMTTVEDYGEHYFEDNIINGLPLGYFWNAKDLEIDATQYGEVIVANSTDITIYGKFLDGDLQSGYPFFHLYHSHNIVFENMTMSYNNIAMDLNYCSNITIRDSLFIENNICMDIEYTSNVIVYNSTFLNNQRGLELILSPNLQFMNCSSYNTITQLLWCATSSDGIIITDSYFEGDSYVIYLTKINDVLVENNTFSNVNQPVYSASDTTNVTIRGNEITSANEGIRLNQASHWVVVSNVIVHSSYGIRVSDVSSHNNSFYYNTIGWSSTQNAYDDGQDNIWDDNVSQGNMWHDWSGTGTYSISGTAGSEDRYPSSITPTIDHPANVQYEEDATGNEVVWNPHSYDPSKFTIWRNDTVISSGAWDGSELVVTVDGLDAATYNYTIQVNNTISQSAIDTVFVYVEEASGPSVSNPSDISYEEDTTGHSITWNIEEPSPDSYVIYLDDVVQSSGDWDGSDIIFVVDGLALGDHNVTLLVNDTLGHTTIDEVIVTVIDTSNPSISHPSDVTIDELDTDVSVTWTGTDNHPDSYKIFVNGTLTWSGQWNSSSESIVAWLDNLDVGIWNITTVLFDSSGNSASDMVLVTVTTDNTAPVLSGPEDLTISEDDTDVYINWTTEDDHPDSYAVYINGTLILSGNWNQTGEVVSLPVSYLDAGVYNVTLVATDSYGNTAFDSVILVVTETTETSTTSTSTTTTTTPIPPADMNPTMLLVIGGGIGAAALVFVLFFLKKKK